VLTPFAQYEPSIRSPGDRGCVVLSEETPRPASAVTTFLFTDIEGSTRRWEADPTAMRAALDTHDEVLRRLVEAHSGRLFNHTGDGVCAAFASPRSAVDAAVAAQLALELPVRMGIVTGEAETRGADFSGTVLNRAARVMSSGHGGQILLDGATAGLLTGIDLVELGPRRLRDIARPVELFQVRADGLRTEFPPLKTLDSTPGNLKPQTTSFVGRELAVAELETAVKANRLVTLTGVGGVGKTRLALEVAARLKSDFPDGVWVIELAPVGDPSAVPEATAAILGITPQAGLSLSDSIAAMMEGRSRLLVFDNCEHLLEAAADLIETIIEHSSTVRILATSREGLGVADEQLWPVPALDVNAGVDSEAATLFAERAQHLAPEVALSADASSGAIVEICRRLDGIPLAIELAASRMLSMTVTEVRDRLDDRFRLLVGSRRGLERHQTLRHAVQWSYDLLDDTEKVILNRCSVFAGGFDLASACAVTGVDDEIATLDLLDVLVRKSLLVADRSSVRTRFSMLETIRQFAEEQLVASGEADELRNEHARHFAGQESDVLALWNSPRQRESYDWFTLELANLRAAFRWAADHNDLDSAAAIAICAAILGAWVEKFEPGTWAEEIIEPARKVEHRRLAQLYAVTARCFAAIRLDEGVRYAEAGLQAIESGRYDYVPFDIPSELGGIHILKGEPHRWIEMCRNTIADSTDPHILTRAHLAMTLAMIGAPDEAIEESETLRNADSVTENPAFVSWALLAYGYVRHTADPASAFEAHRLSLKIARETGNRLLETYNIGNLSRLAARHGEPAETFDFIAMSIRNYFDAGNLSLLPQAMAVLAHYFDRLGHYEAAATISGFSTTTFARSYFPEIDDAITHLRDVLGNDSYESLANAGAAMTNAAIANYALRQIDLVRANLPDTAAPP
jgi:predicted ATPase/class 3 adenylate cyclase